jgi:glycosyltransferase involved in cell wall biosynthesis
MPKISVIVPVYNSEETLKTCVDNICAQSFENFELLLCDDGSTDGSAQECDSLALRDPRIKVFHIAHRGVSAARNVGIEHMSGEYMTFADSDDRPHCDWLADMLSRMDGCELSVCGYTVLGKNGERLYGTEDSRINTRVPSTFPAEQFAQTLFSNDFMYQGYVWNKLFRRILVKNAEPLRFDEGIFYNEDRLFIFQYLKKCRMISVSEAPRYDYVQKERSGIYSHGMLTEIAAFIEMTDDLRRSGSERTLYYAEKDMFRASTQLFRLAKFGCYTTDAMWLGKYVLKYAKYATEFEEYPLRDRIDMTQAVIDAAKMPRG